MTQTLTVSKKTRTVKAASKARRRLRATKTAGELGRSRRLGERPERAQYEIRFCGSGSGRGESGGQSGAAGLGGDIRRRRLTYNLNAIRKFVNPEDEHRATPRLVLSIVKGNGYGHGGPQVAKILEKAGSDWFGVTSAAEGIEVRKAGVKKPILVLTSFWPGEEKNLAEV